MERIFPKLFYLRYTGTYSVFEYEHIELIARSAINIYFYLLNRISIDNFLTNE